MAQLAAETNREHGEAVTSDIAHAAPLGLSAFAFTTALLGCVFAGFIVPSVGTNLSITVGAALFYGGLVQILAGMWEFKRERGDGYHLLRSVVPEFIQDERSSTVHARIPVLRIPLPDDR